MLNRSWGLCSLTSGNQAGNYLEKMSDELLCKMVSTVHVVDLAQGNRPRQPKELEGNSSSKSAKTQAQRIYVHMSLRPVSQDGRSSNPRINSSRRQEPAATAFGYSRLNIADHQCDANTRHSICTSHYILQHHHSHG